LKEYETARSYLASYLSENTNDALGWKLMGEISEIADRNWSKAIDYYVKYVVGGLQFFLGAKPLGICLKTF
jgi:hypothetical protein